MRACLVFNARTHTRHRKVLNRFGTDANAVRKRVRQRALFTDTGRSDDLYTVVEINACVPRARERIVAYAINCMCRNG